MNGVGSGCVPGAGMGRGVRASRTTDGLDPAKDEKEERRSTGKVI